MEETLEWNLRRRKWKLEGAREFMKRMRKMQEEAQAALKKVQKEMKRQVDRKKREAEEYWEGDLVLLSTKDLKWQMKGRQTKKLTERFIGPYKVKRVISTNVVELELPETIKIYPVVNVSQIRRYKEQVSGQKKQLALPVIIEGEEEYKVEKIINKRKRYGK